MMGGIGNRRVHAFSSSLIRTRDLSNRAQFTGGGTGDEAASKSIHDLAIDTDVRSDPKVIVVHVRLLGVLEMPTHLVALGRERSTDERKATQ
jgi:hypothetical protein